MEGFAVTLMQEVHLQFLFLDIEELGPDCRRAPFRIISFVNAGDEFRGQPHHSGLEILSHLSYGKFEGKIPSGQYGAGTVIIWDQGTYETKSWSATKIEVTFHGKKLHGEYILRWMGKMNGWLLWKC